MTSTGKNRRRVRFEFDDDELTEKDPADEDPKKKRWGLPEQPVVIGWYALISACQDETRLHWIELMRRFYARHVLKDSDYGVKVPADWRRLLRTIADQARRPRD